MERNFIVTSGIAGLTCARKNGEVFHVEHFVLALLYVQWWYVHENEAARKNHESREDWPDQGGGRGTQAVG